MTTVQAILDEFPQLKRHLEAIPASFLPGADPNVLTERLTEMNGILSSLHMPKLFVLLSHLNAEDLRRRPAFAELHAEAVRLSEISLKLERASHVPGVGARKAVAAQLDTYLPRMRRLLTEEELHLIPTVLGHAEGEARKALEHDLAHASA